MKFCNSLSSLLSKKKSVIAVIKLYGVIGKVGLSKGLTLESIKHIEKIKKIKKLDAIVLLINSPGGSPVQSEMIAKKITSLAQLKDGKKIPIYSFCEDVAASGGYWLACIGDEIYSSNSSIIGSIGVISQGFGFVEAIKKLGIERRVYTQGKNKSVLDPFSQTKNEDIDIIKDIQSDIHNDFISYVKSRRGKKLADNSDIFTGKFWSGKAAKELGLVDGVGYFEEIVKEKFGEKVEFKEIVAKQSFFQKKFGAMVANMMNNFIVSFEEAKMNSKYK
jgi:signal peptide peptidase SppA